MIDMPLIPTPETPFCYRKGAFKNAAPVYPTDSLKLPYKLARENRHQIEVSESFSAGEILDSKPRFSSHNDDNGQGGIKMHEFDRRTFLHFLGQASALMGMGLSGSAWAETESKPDYSKLIIKDLKDPEFDRIKIGSEKLGEPFEVLYSIVTTPRTLAPTPHVHDFAQYWFFWGAGSNDAFEFDAELEFDLGGEIHTVDVPFAVHIPPGVVHCPLRFTRVDKPVGYMEICLAAEYSVKNL